MKWARGEEVAVEVPLEAQVSVAMCFRRFGPEGAGEGAAGVRQLLRAERDG